MTAINKIKHWSVKLPETDEVNNGSCGVASCFNYRPGWVFRTGDLVWDETDLSGGPWHVDGIVIFDEGTIDIAIQRSKQRRDVGVSAFASFPKGKSMVGNEWVSVRSVTRQNQDPLCLGDIVMTETSGYRKGTILDIQTSVEVPTAGPQVLISGLKTDDLVVHAAGISVLQSKKSIDQWQRMKSS